MRSFPQFAFVNSSRYYIFLKHIENTIIGGCSSAQSMYYCFQNKLVTQLHPTHAVNTQLKARINVNIGYLQRSCVHRNSLRLQAYGPGR